MPEKTLLRPVLNTLCLAALWAFVALASPLALHAQITSPDADGSDSLDYPVSGGKVVAYAFHQAEGVEKNGGLTATHPLGGNYSFEWQKFNPVSMDYDPAFHTEAGVSSSSVADLEDGGYRVRVSNGADVDTLMDAWVWKVRLRAMINTDAQGHLPVTQRTCDYLYLLAEVESDSVLYYYDPLHDDPLPFSIGPHFIWTSDNPDLTIPNAEAILSPNISYTPPYEDTWYILTLTDSLGIRVQDSVFYESIQTKAEFSLEYWDKNKLEWNANLTADFKTDDYDPFGDRSDWPEGSTDATLTVRFVNESKNGEEFHWTFLDTLGGIKETGITYDTTERPEFTYIEADEYYYPKLLSISHMGCEDSSVMEHEIYVEPSRLDIPNVFSPNGDNTNERWRFAHQSIKTCKITVVSRSGQVVYKKKIEDIYDWHGWDGNIRESNRPAPPGAYYYVIDAMGYDGKEFRDPGVWEQMKIFGGDGRVDTQNSGTGTGTDNETVNTGIYAGWVYLYRE